MTDVPETKKISTLKILTIFIFIGIITFASIKLVTIAPEAFSSLASLAEGIDEQKDNIDEEEPSFTPNTLTVTSNKAIVTTEESFTLSWGTLDKPGTYTFTYDCTEGVALDILNTEGTRSINCDTSYNIGDTASLSLTADSEKKRYSTIYYKIAFLGTNDTTPRANGEASLTVVNSNISDLFTPEDSEEIISETTAKEPPIKTPVVTTVNTPPPTYRQEYTYTIPVSNPSGRTDLATKFIDTGNIVGDTFFSGAIKQEEKGAIQFEVKNYGTKTSDDWTFLVTLPNGETYASSKQNPLKPNERAVLTIGFTTVDKSNHKFTVTIKEKTDVNIVNNKFIKTVTFLK